MIFCHMKVFTQVFLLTFHPLNYYVDSKVSKKQVSQHKAKLRRTHLSLKKRGKQGLGTQSISKSRGNKVMGKTGKRRAIWSKRK